MARAKKKKRKVTAHMKKFGTVAKAANAVCHRETNSVAAFKKCMHTNMVEGLKKAGYTGKGPKVRKCKGLYKSGPNKGKMKPGYKRGPAGRCPVKKAG